MTSSDYEEAGHHKNVKIPFEMHIYNLELLVIKKMNKVVYIAKRYSYSVYFNFDSN